MKSTFEVRLVMRRRCKTFVPRGEAQRFQLLRLVGQEERGVDVFHVIFEAIEGSSVSSALPALLKQTRGRG